MSALIVWLIIILGSFTVHLTVLYGFRIPAFTTQSLKESTNVLYRRTQIIFFLQILGLSIFHVLAFLVVMTSFITGGYTANIEFMVSKFLLEVGIIIGIEWYAIKHILKLSFRIGIIGALVIIQMIFLLFMGVFSVMLVGFQ